MNVSPTKIKITSRKIAKRYNYEIDAEDVEQDMYLALVEAHDKDPEFSNVNSQWYAMQKAEWAGMEAARKQITYRKYNAKEKYVNGDDDDDNDSISMLELYPSKECTIEQYEMRDTLLSAIAALDVTCQKIVAMLYQGFTQVEIAARLGMTPAAISQKKIITNGSYGKQTKRTLSHLL